MVKTRKRASMAVAPPAKVTDIQENKDSESEEELEFEVDKNPTVPDDKNVDAVSSRASRDVTEIEDQPGEQSQIEDNNGQSESEGDSSENDFEVDVNPTATVDLEKDSEVSSDSEVEEIQSVQKKKPAKKPTQHTYDRNIEKYACLFFHRDTYLRCS